MKKTIATGGIMEYTWIYILPGKTFTGFEPYTYTMYKIWANLRYRTLKNLLESKCTNYTLLCKISITDIERKVGYVLGAKYCIKISAREIRRRLLEELKSGKGIPVKTPKKIVEQLKPRYVYTISKKEICKGIDTRKYRKIAGAVGTGKTIIIIT